MTCVLGKVEGGCCPHLGSAGPALGWRTSRHLSSSAARSTEGPQVSPDGRGHQGRQHHPRGGPESTRSHTPTYARWRPPHGFAATGLRFQVTVGARARHLSVSPGEMQKVGIPCLKRMDSVVSVLSQHACGPSPPKSISGTACCPAPVATRSINASLHSSSVKANALPGRPVPPAAP